MSPETSSKGLIWAIVFSALVISGALVFLAYQLGATKSGADTASLLELKKLLADKPDDTGRSRGSSPRAAEPVKPVNVKKDHIRGDLNAPISLIEYSDFECPFCKRAHPVFQQLVDDNKGKVNWVYRQFPLSFHDPLATKQALASECAGELGGNDGFWKYTDLIFKTTNSNGNGMPIDDLPKLAAQIGLNQKKFNECFESEKYKTHVQDDIAEGSAAGVTGTPGNFVVLNKTGKSEVVSGAQPYVVFQAAIDRLLAE